MPIFQLSLEKSILHKLKFYQHLKNIKIYLMVYLKRIIFFSCISIRPMSCCFQCWDTLSSWSSSFSWQDSVITLEIRHSLWSLSPTGSRFVSCLAVGSAFFLLANSFHCSLQDRDQQASVTWHLSLQHNCGNVLFLGDSWVPQHLAHSASPPQGMLGILHSFNFTKGLLLTVSSNTW